MKRFGKDPETATSTSKCEGWWEEGVPPTESFPSTRISFSCCTTYESKHRIDKYRRLRMSESHATCKIHEFAPLSFFPIIFLFFLFRTRAHDIIDPCFYFLRNNCFSQDMGNQPWFPNFTWGKSFSFSFSREKHWALISVNYLLFPALS